MMRISNATNSLLMLPPLAFWIGVCLCCTAVYAAEQQFDTEPSGQYSNEALTALATKFGIADEVATVKIKTNAKEQSQIIEFLLAQNQVNKRMATVFFESNAVIADVTAEISNVRRRREKLENARQRAITTTNTLNFLTWIMHPNRYSAAKSIMELA
jgi:hypothetical protein